MHWAWQALGVHVSSLSYPMNAIILAQVGSWPKKAFIILFSKGWPWWSQGLVQGATLAK